ncbi:cysteine hydrolase family protein [Nitrospirillum sp. BR 11163]|uniref:cysteine hydrolase family protein n=1 Tax=Nitrospirillum sp. BR 11163 TaxID=3104323 RepID=UPI002AFDD846|nr:isochorismatase family protein [Nitrospirillum sp. BR 11163]MEA1673775.1 isochorismatase family protein [Nitrospirillum sp. BR 11163]
MAVTTLDARTALIVIDLQKGLLAMPGLPPLDGILQNAADLAAAFRRKGLPVVLVTVTGGPPGRTEQGRVPRDLPVDWTELVPELDAQPGDHRVVKRTWGAFPHTDLDAYLKGRDVTQVVLAGVATSIGVESTAREAHALGYNVTLAVDAMADRDAEAHDHSVTRIFPRLGEIGTTAGILALLDGTS